MEDEAETYMLTMYFMLLQLAGRVPLMLLLGRLLQASRGETG
jgi:hypothetical protein